MSTPKSSDLSEPPSPAEFDPDEVRTPVSSSRPSVDISHADIDHQGPPAKRRKVTALNLTHHSFDNPPSPFQDAYEDDQVSISSDGFSDAPGSPSHDEYTLADEAQRECMWKDCAFGVAPTNDDLVQHVQETHCATGKEIPKKTKYVCEWGECQKKTSAHPSGYALKAHMRSHTKEKPYYCALPECDKAFTRSDALAKHMRTVHEPEQPKGAVSELTPAAGKGKSKAKPINGAPGKPAIVGMGNGVGNPPAIDENGQEIDPSPANDNISYLPAHHPITGQPGFMIHYPPDINFTTFESAIGADVLMRLIRRQLHWALQEQEQLQKEVDDLEKVKKEEWAKKEMVLQGFMETELCRGARKGLLSDVPLEAGYGMEEDVQMPSLNWEWKRWEGSDVGDGDGIVPPWGKFVDVKMPWREPSKRKPDFPRDGSLARDASANGTPSPPPTGRSGGFDGDADPYDNYLTARMAEYEERERLRDLATSPSRPQQERRAAAESDAAGALLGLGGS